tara:strand:+ start:455 stop:760 length:306 start_codon:yes stop_codon:yes gene_type:complete
MNRNKTAQLLNEWKSFLNEEKLEFSSNDVDNKLSVKISSCCKNCKKYFKENKLKNLDGKTGTLTSNDVNNRKIPGLGMVNFVVVKIGKIEKQFPECCVKHA